MKSTGHVETPASAAPADSNISTPSHVYRPRHRGTSVHPTSKIPTHVHFQEPSTSRLSSATRSSSYETQSSSSEEFVPDVVIRKLTNLLLASDPDFTWHDFRCDEFASYGEWLDMKVPVVFDRKPEEHSYSESATATTPPSSMATTPSTETASSMDSTATTATKSCSLSTTEIRRLDHLKRVIDENVGAMAQGILREHWRCAGSRHSYSEGKLSWFIFLFFGFLCGSQLLQMRLVAVG